MKRIHQIAMLAMVAAIVACNRVPSDVIQPEDMAELMADIHTGESVVEMNMSLYNNDSLRLALKESIYIEHGVTSEQVDSSFMWYGRHIEKYMEVYDRTIEILEYRLAEKGHLAAAESAMSASGDSVDVWDAIRSIRYNNRMPSPYITFNLKKDPNWEIGDIYTWRAKFVLGGLGSRWNIVADYADGTTEVLNGTIGNEGWNEITFFADSTRTLRRVYGSLQLANSNFNTISTPTDEIWLDSISLVRNRLNRNYYPQRYKQRIYNYKL